MTRMGKVLLALLVLLLICSPAIGADTSTTKDKGEKVVKLVMNKDTGQIVGVRLKKDGGDQDATMVSPTTPGTVIGTILFYKSSPGCTVIISGNWARQVCW